MTRYIASELRKRGVVVTICAYTNRSINFIASNVILKKMKPNRWLPFIVGAWGLVTTLSGLVQNYGGLVAIRLMLGLCEGGVLPGMVNYKPIRIREKLAQDLSGSVLEYHLPAARTPAQASMPSMLRPISD